MTLYEHIKTNVNSTVVDYFDNDDDYNLGNSSLADIIIVKAVQTEKICDVN